MRLRIILIFGFLVIVSMACSPQASAPVTQPQIPTAVEYAGGDITGDLSAQVGKSLLFSAIDEDGETVSDPDITMKVFDPEGELIDYGSVVIEDEEISYTLGQCLPNVPSWVTLKFYYEDEEIGSFRTNVSVDPNSEYSFTDGVLISAEGGYADTPSLVAASNGTLYACYRAKTFSDEETCQPGRNGGPEVCYYPLTSTKLVVVKGVASGNMCDDSYSLEWTELTSIENEALPYSFGSGCKIAIQEMDGDDNGYYDVETIAVAWPSAFADTYDPVDGRPVTNVIDTYEVAFSTDDGATFSEPMQLNSVDVTPLPGSPCGIGSPERLGIVFDESGRLNAAYETVSCTEHDEQHNYRDVYYARCSTSECEDSVRVNSEEGSVSGDNQSVPMAVYEDNIYIVWEDIRNSETFDVGNLYMAEINSPVDADVEVVRNARVDDLDGLWSTVPSIAVDHDRTEPSLVVTWSGIDITDITAKIYITRWNAEEESFDPSTVVSDVEEGELAFFSHITADYSNTYHIVYNYAPFGATEFDMTGSGIKYTFGTYSDSTFDLTNSDDIFTEMEANGSLTTIGDLAGRTYAFWVEAIDDYNYEIYLSIGTQ